MDADIDCTGIKIMAFFTTSTPAEIAIADELSGSNYLQMAPSNNLLKTSRNNLQKAPRNNLQKAPRNNLQEPSRNNLQKIRSRKK
jgi:hypothetical protein